MVQENAAAWSPLPQRKTMFELAAAKLEEMIAAGRWKKGEMLPSEVELAESFGVAQGTMRRALRILSEKGILVRHQGKGTFVADYLSVASSVAARYVLLVPDEKTSPLPFRTELELFEEIEAPAEVARGLAVPVGTPVIHVKRAHYIQGAVLPQSLDEHFLPKALFGALTRQAMERHEEKVLYAFYQNACGVTVMNYNEEVKAEILDAALCERYGFESPCAALIGRRVATTFGGQPVEYRIQHYLTRGYHFQISV